MPSIGSVRRSRVSGQSNRIQPDGGDGPFDCLAVIIDQLTGSSSLVKGSSKLAAITFTATNLTSASTVVGPKGANRHSSSWVVDSAVIQTVTRDSPHSRSSSAGDLFEVLDHQQTRPPCKVLSGGEQTYPVASGGSARLVICI